MASAAGHAVTLSSSNLYHCAGSSECRAELPPGCSGIWRGCGAGHVTDTTLLAALNRSSTSRSPDEPANESVGAAKLAGPLVRADARPVAAASDSQAWVRATPPERNARPS